jgi:hypothetical protein
MEKKQTRFKNSPEIRLYWTEHKRKQRIKEKEKKELPNLMNEQLREAFLA